jgi:sugar lactone lactonase YvrE
MLCAERITPPVAFHGEGPFWDSRHQRLLCVDVLAGTIVGVDAQGRIQRFPVPSPAATVVRRRAVGGFVVATEHGLVLADDELKTFVPLVDITDDPALRTNDGGCDPFGGFVVGTMAYDERPDAGSVYRITPEGLVTKLLSPVTISNGIQWSADGTRAYYIDTPTRRIDVFTVDRETGAWSGRRPHVHVEGNRGLPDGMAIDEEGGLWVALWNAGEVHHYDESGRFVESIAVPGVSQVSSCTFGGDGRTVLYVTSSRIGLPPDREPDAGAVFAVQTSIRGACLPEFAG